MAKERNLNVGFILEIPIRNWNQKENEQLKAQILHIRNTYKELKHDNQCKLDSVDFVY